MKIAGVVIRSLDYKETSKIVYLYTPSGIKSVLAKGARKIKTSLREFTSVGNYLTYECTKGDLPSLIDFSIIDSFNHLKEDLKNSLYFYHILELLYKIPNDINHERAFLFVTKMLTYSKSVDVILIASIIQMKFTFLFGANPNFDETAGRCFSLKSGMFVNTKLETFESLSKEEYKIFKLLYTFNINDSFSIFNNLDYSKFFRLINIYYNYHIDINLKGLNTLYTIKN